MLSYLMANVVRRWLGRVIPIGTRTHTNNTEGETQTISDRGKETYKYRSRWWFLLPILVNIIGGVIAYFALRHDDPRKALDCLWCGIALFGLLLLPFAILIIIGLMITSSFD